MNIGNLHGTDIIVTVKFRGLPWKHQETIGFLIFSRDVERDQWHEMGWWANKFLKPFLASVIVNLRDTQMNHCRPVI